MSSTKDPAGDPSDVGGATLEDTSPPFKSSSATENAKVREEKGKPIETTTTLRSEPKPTIKTTVPTTAPSPITTPVTVTPKPSFDEQVSKLSKLAEDLRTRFQEDATRISSIESIIKSDSPPTYMDGYIDPRNLESREPEGTLTHVFIDNSNIYVGFKKHSTHQTDPKKAEENHTKKEPILYYAALILLLERGRFVTKRVFVGSKRPPTLPIPSSEPPQRQNPSLPPDLRADFSLTLPVFPVERPGFAIHAEELGYQVHVLTQIPDMGDGMNGGSRRSSMNKGSRRNSMNKGSRRGSMSYPVEAAPFQRTRSGSTDPPTPPHMGTITVGRDSPIGTSGGFVDNKCKEQAVDEVLQVRLYEAITDVKADSVPPNSTIILATGDGNTEGFSERGFRGCVRFALKRGWRVELYSWRDELSRLWRTDFGEDIRQDRLRIRELDDFVEHLRLFDLGV